MSKQILILNRQPPHPRKHCGADRRVYCRSGGGGPHRRPVRSGRSGHPRLPGLPGRRKGSPAPLCPADGMDAVYPAYMAADVVVLASPMYYWASPDN